MSSPNDIFNNPEDINMDLPRGRSNKLTLQESLPLIPNLLSKTILTKWKFKVKTQTGQTRQTLKSFVF